MAERADVSNLERSLPTQLALNAEVVFVVAGNFQIRIDADDAGRTHRARRYSAPRSARMCAGPPTSELRSSGLHRRGHSSCPPSRCLAIPDSGRLRPMTLSEIHQRSS